jgi:nucleotide-binding universal stress UspA family protein
MFERIVVALDGSPEAEAVLAPVEALAADRPAELILTQVRGIVPVYAAAGSAAFVPEAPTDYLRGLASRFAGRLPPVRLEERVGTPVSGILEVARERDASLIAMATHGRRGLERWLFGSVTELVLRESPVPVLAVRRAAGRPAPRPRTLLVPLDGSLDARSAIPTAVKLARRFGARVLLLRAVEGDALRREAARRRLLEIGRGLAAAGVPGQALVSGGPPAEAILRTCAEQAVDLIVMATHGRRGWARLQGGSVTEDVLRGAPVPVLAVRAVPEPAQAWRRGAEDEAA